MIGKVLLGAVGAIISIGLAAPSGADPVTTAGSVGAPQPDAVSNFLAAARAAGVTGTDPAMLGNGYSAPRTTRFSFFELYQSSHHCHTLPPMSCRPLKFASKLPTGLVLG